MTLQHEVINEITVSDAQYSGRTIS